MMNQAKDKILKEAYKSASLGISTIEHVLPSVESDDLSYDLNRQVHEYFVMAQRCKNELERSGEALDTSYFIRADENVGARCQGDESKNDKYGRKDSDCAIAKHVYENTMDSANKFSKLLKEAGGKERFAMEIADEFLKEEKKHMHRMQSYF